MAKKKKNTGEENSLWSQIVTAKQFDNKSITLLRSQFATAKPIERRGLK